MKKLIKCKLRRTIELLENHEYKWDVVLQPIVTIVFILFAYWGIKTGFIH